jgi:GAF domain-containing protein
VTSSLYRIYLYAAGKIVCRHDLEADDDAGACRAAQMLAGAGSDICDGVDIWQADRLVAGPLPPDRSTAGPVPASVIRAAEALLGSAWTVARSKRLSLCVEGWRRQPDAGLLERLIRDAVAATGATMGNIQLHDGAGSLRIVAQQGCERDFLDYFVTVRREDDDASCGRALATAKRVVVEDVASHPIFRGKPAGAVLLRAGCRSTCSTPIIAGGTVLGMVSTHRGIKWRPDADELRRLDRFTDEAAAIIGS